MLRSLAVLITIVMLCFGGNSLAWLSQGPAPVVDPSGVVFDAETGSLTIKGENFLSGATAIIRNEAGAVSYGGVKVKGSKKLIITGVSESDLQGQIEITVVNPDGVSSLPVRANIVPIPGSSVLTADDVRKIIAQAVAQADVSNLKVTVAVTDKEGNVLGVFRMRGATDRITIGIGTRCARTKACIKDFSQPIKGKLTCGLEGLCGKGLATAAAISKAGTAGVLSTAGGAFSTRSANFLLQEHLPPGIAGTPAGPLFGVQFSQLACSDINPSLPLGLAADPGGVALYKNGQPVGGVGVEGDGKYGLANRREERQDKPVEELIAIAGTRGFEPPAAIADTLFPDALRLPYVNQQMPPAVPLRAFNNLDGDIVAPFSIRGTPASKFEIINLNGIPVRAKIDKPIRGSSAPGGLTKAEVERILTQGIRQALVTRAIIHQPVGSHIEVSVGVVDQNGEYLGAVSTTDAPISSYDIAVQKARTAAFLSNSRAGNQLRQASGGSFLPNRPFAKYAEAARRDGINLDGSIAISGRGVIFLSRPFLPDGIDDTPNGPFSNPIEDNSAFNTGLQLDLVISRLLESAVNLLVTGQTQGDTLQTSCSPDPNVLGFNIANGLQVRQASVPLYKNGRLVGGIGCSGDGGEQEDIVVGFGSAGFESDPSIRTDKVFVRGVRLPWLKFPRHPDIDTVTKSN
ncbi:MAG TPA: hypothetical protein VKA70_03950 [Blastocatellia bacterium]|nr:hypothetical protein [Blastocatellia bacterium]